MFCRKNLRKQTLFLKSGEKVVKKNYIRKKKRKKIVLLFQIFA